MKLIIFGIFFVCAIGLARSSDGVCHNDIVCPSTCPEPGQHPLTAIIMPMFTFEDFRNNMENAIAYIKKFPGVIKTDGGVKLHTSLNYFCCMTNDELGQVQSVLESFKWTPLNVTFDHAVCNMDPLDPGKYSIVAFVDEATNQVMGDLAARVEKALLDAGIKLMYRRADQEGFHSTMGQVQLDYPVENVLAYINKKIKKYNREPAQLTMAILTSPLSYFKIPSNNTAPFDRSSVMTFMKAVSEY